MKKILYISGSVIPSKYANSVHVMKMCQAFAKNGIDTTLTAMGAEDLDVFKFYNVEKIFKIHKTKDIKNNVLRFIKYNYLCLSKIKNHDGIVFLRYFYPLVWCLIYKKPVILEFHGVPTSKLIKFLLSKVFKSKRFVSAIFITEKLKDRYLKEFNISINKCKVLADCADLPNEIIENSNKEDIGYVGHLYEGRGIEIIIETAKLMKNTNFHIIGGTEKDIEKYQSISPANIKYYGFLTQSELTRAYGKFSIALAPYQDKVGIGKEGSDTAQWMSPMKVFEYMSYKKVIIMSDLPPLREIGDNKFHFLYVSPTDFQEWVNAIQHVQSNNNFFNHLRENAHQHFLNNFTWDKRSKSITEVIESYNILR